MKKIISTIAALMLTLAVISPAIDAKAQTGTPIKCVDNAGILTESECRNVAAVLEELSDKYDCDIVVVTVDGISKNIVDFADDYFDYNGYGQGQGRDGILLAIDMNERDWAMSTRGFAIKAINDDGLEVLEESFLQDLSNARYEKAFLTFGAKSAELISSAREGNVYHHPKDLGAYLITSLAIGCIVAFIIMLIYRSQLKSVGKAYGAAEYTRPGSFKLNAQRDIYLYRHVDRRAKPQNNGSSSTHRSSSGAVHGGSHGKF